VGGGCFRGGCHGGGGAADGAGRIDDNFVDHNASLLAELGAAHGALVSVEMEAGALFHLARCAKGRVRAASCCVVLANRLSKAVIAAHRVAELERDVGRCVLRALSMS
jgi:uridine phosphorylase